MADSPDKADSDSQEVIFDGRYKLVSKVGAGGMGAVWLGYDMVLDKPCAIKVLLPNSQAEAFIRFHQEAKMAAKLSHPNIMSVFDFGQSDRGDLYLIMDFLDGESLADWTKRQEPLRLADAVAVFLQICDGLGHAHSQGVLHRDIKPSNIMLVKDDRGFVQVKIVDFGLAKFEGVEQSLTTTGVHVGSPMYMSPEQAISQSIDHRSDIYSLGCLMFKTLTKRTPFQSDTLLDILNKHANEIPPSINDVDESLQCPKVLADIVAKTLEKDPNDRFQTINELKEALLSIDASLLSVPSDAVSSIESETLDSRAVAVESSKFWSVKVLTALAALAICGSFIFYTLSTLGGAEVTQPKKKSRVEKTVLEEIVGDGMLDDKLRGPIHGRLSAEPDFGDEDMHTILRYKDQNHLSLEDSKVTGKRFETLRELPLTDLNLRHINIKDNDLTTIGKMVDLETLRIGRNRIGDAAITNIEPLKNLKLIDLEDTHITDQGLRELSKFPALKSISLKSCQKITGQGLLALTKISTLESLDLVDCKKITRQDISKFNRAMPLCLLTTTETEKVAKAREKKTEKLYNYENPKFRKFLKYRKDLYDKNFRRFFRQPENWELDDREIAKIKDKNIVACLKDRDYIKDPEVRKLWLSDGTWAFLAERERETENTFDVLKGPMGF